MICSLEQAAPGATQTLVVCVASSFSWLALAAPLVGLLALAAALWGVDQARLTARRRATLDLIEKVESAPHYRELHGVFAYYRRSDAFGKLHNPTEEKDRRDRTSVLDYLNHYELVAIGIENRILDPKIYQEWMLGPFVRDWNAASAFIQRERWKYEASDRKWSYHAPLFQNYQRVATTWSVEAVRLDKTTGGPPARPEGPGDEPLPGGEVAAA